MCSGTSSVGSRTISSGNRPISSTVDSVAGSLRAVTVVPPGPPHVLAQERARRWWRSRRPVRSIERAAAFVDDVGFALLFPSRGVELPSLLEATSDRTIGQLGVDWGPDTERVWWWKDELPRRGLAWYGRFLRGRPSLLSRELLADLYPRAGRAGDF